MKSFYLLLASGAVLAAGVWQANVPAPLAGHFEKLKAAQTLSVTYNFRVVGEPAVAYQLSMAKPNLFKLTTPDGFVQSDGKSLYTFNAKDKSYTETPLDDSSFGSFLQRPEILGWSAFFTANPTADLTSAKAGASRTLQGKQVTEVEVAFKNKWNSTLFIENTTRVARGYTLKVEGKEYLVMATALETGATAKPATEFAFVAPEGAKKVEPSEAKATFAQVNRIIAGNCMPCHSANRMSAGINLSSHDGIKAAVTPGDGANSRLVRSLRASGPARMPKNRGPLSEDQIKLIETWINDGANP